MDTNIVIKSIPGMAWSADIMAGKRQFPTFNKAESNKKPFKEYLEAAMEKNNK